MNSFLRCRLLQKPLIGASITLASHSSHYSCYDFVKLVDEFAHDRALRSGTILHAHIVVNVLSVLSRIASRLAVFYIECGRSTDAHQMLLVKCGFYTDALGHFQQTQRQGLRTDKFVFPRLLKAFGQLPRFSNRRGLARFDPQIFYLRSAFVDFGLIDMYAKCGCVGKAGKVFDGTEEMDLVMLNAMVSGYGQNGYPQEAFRLVEHAKSIGLKLDVVTWNAVITGFAKSGDLALGREIFVLMRSHCTEPDVVS